PDPLEVRHRLRRGRDVLLIERQRAPGPDIHLVVGDRRRAAARSGVRQRASSMVQYPRDRLGAGEVAARGVPYDVVKHEGTVGVLGVDAQLGVGDGIACVLIRRAEVRANAEYLSISYIPRTPVTDQRHVELVDHRGRSRAQVRGPGPAIY